ncbi:MAG: hypothetical protein SO445_10400 [Lachnospiraceae bacterium]|nr:hypothetical protein [Lachnospiraceae bacterium]MDD6182939.1 hypothetical protein [Lachnospiraceae bacterium]MDD7379580.1 hypothetical protein [Lachnospiraceae bacterium]MDY4618098.1 hypothetical protein [Lachnospiraceae bacterium]MDY5776026.1 hypothetical protein [Lachnospiraceae bacterium]
MSRNRRKNGNKWMVVLVCVVIVIAVLGILFKVLIYDTAKEKVAEKIVQKMIETELANDESGTGQEAQEIYDSMTQEEKDSLNRMVEDKMDTKTIKEVKEYVEAGDREGLKAYVKESFSDSDIQEMREIYEKYK